jgi:hypothetical protein
VPSPVSGGSLVFLIRPPRTGFRRIWHVPGFCCGDAGSEARVRDALADALMWPGGVVILLVFGQEGAQVLCRAVPELVQWL